MTGWPKCSVCHSEIGSGEPFVVVEHEPLERVIVVAHDRCVSEPKPRVRRMNEARAWAVREYATLSPADGVALTPQPLHDAVLSHWQGVPPAQRRKEE